MDNTKHTASHATHIHATLETADCASEEIAKLDITENGEWGRSFHDGVKLATPNTESTPGTPSLLDELNSLDRAA